MASAEITTLELARVIGVSVQTIRRTARELGISPKKSGKSFVFSQSQAAQIANKLKRHIRQHDIAKDDAETGQNVSHDANSDVNDLFGAIKKAMEPAPKQEVTISLEEYADLVSKSSKLGSAREREEILKGRIEALEDEEKSLRRELEEARERLYEARHRRLTWRERLFGRPMPSLPERVGD